MKVLIIVVTIVLLFLYASLSHFSLYPEHILALFLVDELPTWTLGGQNSKSIGTSLAWHPKGLIVCGPQTLLLDGTKRVISGPSHGAVYADGVIYTVHANGLYKDGIMLYRAPKPILGVAVCQGDGVRSSLPLAPQFTEKIFRGRRVWVPELFVTRVEVNGVAMINSVGKFLVDNSLPVRDAIGKIQTVFLPEPDAPVLLDRPMNYGNSSTVYADKYLPDEFVLRGEARLVDPGLWSSPASVMAHQFSDSAFVKPTELNNEYAERFNYAVEAANRPVKERGKQTVYIWGSPVSYFNDSLVTIDDVNAYLAGNKQLCVYGARTVDDKPAGTEISLFEGDIETVDGKKVPVGVSAVYAV